MRKGEILDLKKEDVDITRGRYGSISLRKWKAEIPKVISLGEILSRYLKKLVLESPNEYVLQFDRSGD